MELAPPGYLPRSLMPQSHRSCWGGDWAKAKVRAGVGAKVRVGVGVDRTVLVSRFGVLQLLPPLPGPPAHLSLPGLAVLVRGVGVQYHRIAATASTASLRPLRQPVMSPSPFFRHHRCDPPCPPSPQCPRRQRTDDDWRQCPPVPLRKLHELR